MFRTNWAASLAALLTLAAGAAQAGPQDSHRPGGQANAPVVKLKGFKGEANTLQVRGAPHHGYSVGRGHSFQHGYSGGYARSFQHGYAGGYGRSFQHGYAGGYGHSFHYGYYRPNYYSYYGSRFYRPYFYGYDRPFWGFALGSGLWPGYYGSPIIYPPPVYDSYCPPGISLPSVVYSVLGTKLRAVEEPSRIEAVPSPSIIVPPVDGTYPYDGGPVIPVPMPGSAPAPTKAPAATVPLDGRLVSIPAPSNKYQYLAYGEKPRPTEESKPPFFRVVKLQLER